MSETSVRSPSTPIRVLMSRRSFAMRALGHIVHLTREQTC
jgi:hypothetical protein